MTAIRDDVEVHAENFAALSKAIKDRNLARMRELLEGGASVNTCEGGDWGKAVLHVAARADFAEGVKLLIQLGADPGREVGAYTPIQEAVLSGGVAALEVLIESGTSTIRTNRHGHTPLMTAAEEGMTDAAEMLLRLSPRTREEPELSWALSTAVKWQSYGRDRTKMIQHMKRGGAQPAPFQAKVIAGAQPPSVVHATMPNDDAAAVRVVIAQCAHCGGPLRAKRGSLRSVMSMTCKCGQRNEVHVESTIIEEIHAPARQRRSVASSTAVAAPTRAAAATGAAVAMEAATTTGPAKPWRRPLIAIVGATLLVVAVLILMR